MHYSRREFLKYATTTGAALGAGGLCTACGFLTPNDLPPASLVPPLTPTDKAARVVAVLGRDLRSMVRDALDSFGGASAIVRPQETVFIKPNLVGAGMVRHELFSTGECTKPEVFMTVAEECLKAGATKVTIGDAAQVSEFAWDEMWTLDRSTNVADEAKRLNDRYEGTLELACLNSDTPVWVPVTSPYSGLEKIYVSGLAAHADRIISIPVVKTHRHCQVTLSMKNLMGLTSSERYGEMGIDSRIQLHRAPGGLEQTFLDITAALRPDFTLIDASIGCEGNGPHVQPRVWGTTVDLRDRIGNWLILASNDLVAADATATRIIGHKPNAVKHLASAFDRGLGQAREDLIELEGADLNDLRMDWEPAKYAASIEAVALPGLMMYLERPN